MTVAANPMEFHRFCVETNLLLRASGSNDRIKPLHIELNNFETQLMCAANFNPCHIIMLKGFPIIRIKREVDGSLFSMSEREQREACYWEAHIKLDGVFQPGFRMSSRDLFRTNRWYVTRREKHPFDPAPFYNSVGERLKGVAIVAGIEYEACILDSCPELDRRWV